MAFSTIWYFSFWSLISQIFVTAGLRALYDAKLPIDDTSFYLIRLFIAFPVCCSCSYAFLFRPPLEQAAYLISNDDFLKEFLFRQLVTLVPIAALGIKLMADSSSIVLYLLCFLSALPFSVILLSRNSDLRIVFRGMATPFIMYPSHTILWIFFNLLFCIVPFTSIYFQNSLIYPFLDQDIPLEIIKMYSGCSILSVVVVNIYLFGFALLKRLLGFSRFLPFIRKRTKVIEMIIGFTAYIIVQYIIRQKSVALMLALLSFAITWLGLVALATPSTDFGVFKFLIGAILDCTLSNFRLGTSTWIVTAVCILLVIISWKLDAVTLRYSGIRGDVLSDWKCVELCKQLLSVARISTMSSDEEIDDKKIMHFRVSPSTSIKIQKGNITKWFVDGSSDAIVNSANEEMLGGGGCDGAIHIAAGEELLEACYQVPEVRRRVRCPTGEARITRGFRLPASSVIHTVGPIYYASRSPEVLLRNAYKSSLDLANANNIKYIAFPAISCGIYGYPIDEAAEVALSAVKDHANNLKEVHFVLFTDDIYTVWLEKALSCKVLNIS